MTREVTVSQKGSTDPCLCNSGKTWGKCCGALLEEKDVHLIRTRMTNATAKYWIVGNPLTSELYADETGQVPVFSAQAQAMMCSEKAGVCSIIGVSEAKFAVFAKAVPNHYMVPESTVSA